MTRLFLLILVLLLPASGSDRTFQDPPERYGPSAFWWWFVGAPYTAEDVRTAVNVLKAAGLGGVRITPVYSFPGGQSGGPTYLSPGYLDLVRTAVESAHQAGLVVDALLGTGWPFGGPYIPAGMGASQLKHYVAEVRGPGVFHGKIPGTLGAGERLLAVQAGEATSAGGIDLSTIVDLTGQVRDWRLPDWQIPPGRWALLTFVSGKTGMKVKRAAPGGEGLVLDHFRREALDLHLRHNGDVQAPFLRGVGAVTMDSWEVFGANWTPAMPTEFARRRGYRLEPYLAALFFPAGEIGARVRYDFRKTISELALQNFFEPLRDWAHTHGFQTRVEAHGTPADIIEAYGVNDTPEAETYGPQDRPGFRIRDRRLAASAAHLFGRRQVSCETFTWLRYPLFRESLQQMKTAADASYLDGVNQVNFHGVSFSPFGTPQPGYYFYASTFVSAGNTWWAYLPRLSNYLRRANYLLQQGEPVTDVAVYIPTEDVWSSATGPWYDLAGGIEERLRDAGSVDLLESLQKAGYQFDFINGRRIEEGAAAKYRVVVLPDVEVIEPAVLRRLVEFRQSGGIVLAYGRTPRRGPGMQKARGQDSEVANLATRLFPQGSDMAFPRYTAQSLDPANHPLTAWLMTKLEPDVLSRDLAGSIGFVHRREASDDIYFLVNLRDTAIRFHGSFRVDSTYPHALDPETGNSAPVFEYRRESGRTTVSYPLAPRQAVFIVFRPEKVPAVAAHNVDSVLALSPSRATAEVSSNGMFFVNAGGERLVASVTGLPAPLEVAGPWQLTVPGVGSRTVDVLRDWTEYEEFARFSGTAAYKTQFALPEAWRRNGQRLVLEMEQVHEVAEVYLNNKAAGVAWKAPFQVTLPGPLAAKNFLEIHVTNLLFNRMLGAERLPPPYVPLARIYPQPLTSGLIGRVRIRPVRTIQLAP